MNPSYRLVRHSGRRNSKWRIVNSYSTKTSYPTDEYEKFRKKLRAGAVALIEFGDLGPEIIYLSHAPWLRTRW